jgi:hypothetical protein
MQSLNHTSHLKSSGSAEQLNEPLADLGWQLRPPQAAHRVVGYFIPKSRRTP